MNDFEGCATVGGAGHGPTDCRMPMGCTCGETTYPERCTCHLKPCELCGMRVQPGAQHCCTPTPTMAPVPARERFTQLIDQALCQLVVERERGAFQRGVAWANAQHAAAAARNVAHDA